VWAPLAAPVIERRVMNEKREIEHLERRVRKIERRLDELVRLLKRSQDSDVEYAARRAQ
jgi:hypothetical protein